MRGTLDSKTTGDQLTAAEFIEIPKEIENIIDDTGQTPSSGNLDQLGIGVSEYAASSQWYTDSGAADAYVLSKVGNKQAPSRYSDGMVVRFRATNNNTGASTINVNGLGSKDITREDGSALQAQDISTAKDTLLRYDDSAGDFFLIKNSGIWEEIAENTIGGSVGSFEITDLTNDYLVYKLILSNSLHTASNTEVYLQFSVNNGSSYKGAGEYSWNQLRASNGSVSCVVTTDGDIALTYNNDLGSSKWIEVDIFEPGTAGVVTGVIHRSISVNTASGMEHITGGGFDTSASGTVINAIRVSATNNFTAGTWKLIGLRR